MLTVFFDLETSDRYFLGQILNYSFVALDQDWEEIASLSGLVRLSRLQLPSPSAILANRVDVIEHQNVAVQTEAQAVQRIAEFLDDLTDHGQRRINLLGFNSNRFDIPYLRTIFYRNGVNPYFHNALNYRDAFLAAKKLYLSRADFPQPKASDNPKKLALKLESLAQAFGLLSGAQAHEAHADVMLLIELCRLFQRDFGLDPREFVPYEVSKLHGEKERLVIVERLEPNYDLASDQRILRRRMSYLEGTQKNALWVDLDRYQENPDLTSIRWFNCSTHDFSAGEVYPQDHDLYRVAAETKAKFAKVTVNNLFPRSSCDIEQDVYRIDFSTLEALGASIVSGSAKPLEGIKDQAKSIDAKVLFCRYLLANYQVGSGDDAKFKQDLKKFALRRYGGGAQLSKSIADPDQPGEGAYAPSLVALFQEIEGKLADAQGADKTLLTALKRYYIESEIYQTAGAELGVNGVLQS